MSGVREPAWCALLLIGASSLSAQGVSTAALGGRVTTQTGLPIPNAIVLVTSTSTGARWQTSSRSSGRYSFEHLPAGGPYEIEARAIGYGVTGRIGVLLALGQREVVDLALSPAAMRLDSLVVWSVPSATGAGGNGISRTIPESVIVRLPILGRDVFSLTLLSPSAVSTRSGGLSIAGQPDRLNGLQIDGAANIDLLGASTLGLGTPGQGLGARTLSPEAVQELQIIIAPFDVRLGNFAAGLINAVTRSGTNRFEGSLGTWYSGGSLVGRDRGGERGAGFNTGEVSATLAGPIVRNRAGFFLDLGVQRLVLPQDVPLIGIDTAGGQDSSATGIRRASLTRFQEILSRRYGVDPGTAEPFPLTATPVNAFGKITVQLGVNSRLDVSHNFAHDTPNLLTFVPVFGCRERGFFCLGSRGFRLPVTVNATRLTWSSTLATGVENDLQLARLQEHNACVGATGYAGILVHADRGILSAGGADACAGGFTTENILEVTDNLTLSLGSHRLTLGGHGERIRLPTVDALQYFFGMNWYFASLDSLEVALPERFDATQRAPERTNGPLSDLGIHQLGGYLQDQWNVTDRLTLTAGVRLDVPFLARGPERNLDLQSELGLDNAQTPSGNPLWSPRLGWNYELSKASRAVVRGGIGVFAGRPPYKWFDQVFVHTGLEAEVLQCDGPSVPPFALDPAHAPVACGPGAAPLAPFVGVFNPAFRFPRYLKLELAMERRLPWNVHGTLDLLYTRGLDQFALRDLNLAPPHRVEAGEGNRPVYGVIDPLSGFATPERRSAAFGSVLEMRNESGDRALTLSVQLLKHTPGGTDLSLAYAFTNSQDRFSASQDALDADVGAVPLDGTLEHRRLATSEWSVPHKITAMAIVPFKRGWRAALLYVGTSGVSYTYVVRGDANADGFGDAFDGRNQFNDAVYVPAGPGDITLLDPGEYSELARIIDREKCLRLSIGRMTRRNSCRNPWVNTTNFRLSKAFTLAPSHRLEINLDAFNLLALAGTRWGEVRETSGGSAVPLLELAGFDPSAGRGIYRLVSVEHNVVLSDASRWRVQLGARVSF